MNRANVFFVISTIGFLAACGNVGGSLAGDSKPKVGDTVVYKTSPIVYAEGKVEKVDGGKYEIKTGDNIAKADAADVYTIPKAGAGTDLKPGEVAVAWSRESYWAGGEVKNVTADVVEIEPVSGSKINAPHARVIRVSPAAAADIKQAVEKKGFEELGKAKKPVLPKDWKPKKGDKVAAQWSFGTWHVAIIKNVNANNVDIDWQNGWSDGSVAVDKIAPYPRENAEMPAVGGYVIVKPQSDTQEWRFAMVLSLSGTEADVRFGDGKAQKVSRGDLIALM